MSNRVGISVFLTASLLLSAAAARAGTDEEGFPDLEPYRGQPITAIDFTGLQTTKQYVVEREVRSKVGTPLDPGLVKADFTRLQNLPIFGSVMFRAKQEADGIALEFGLNELPWIIPYPSVKYTEENGFAVGAGVSSPNLGGRSQKLSANALFGGMTIYGFAFSDPWITGDHVSLGVKLARNVRQNELLDFGETQDIAGVEGGTYLGRHGRLNGTVAYVGIGCDRDSITLDADNRDELFTVNTVWGYDSRDSWLAPRRGWQNQWLAVSYWGGDANFWTFQVDVNGYMPIREHHSLAFGPLFTFQTGEVGVEIPPYLQYFMGGANTIRGYKLLELGKEMFGKNQLLYNLEYRWNFHPMRTYKIIKWKVKFGFQAAGFADVGIAWTRDKDFSIDRTRFGFGGGLRLLLPVFEMIRFDVGVSQYGDVEFNFGIRSIFFGRRLRVR
jgi:outer membrane protein assembly factor BamA